MSRKYHIKLIKTRYFLSAFTDIIPNGDLAVEDENLENLQIYLQVILL